MSNKYRYITRRIDDSTDAWYVDTSSLTMQRCIIQKAHDDPEPLKSPVIIHTNAGHYWLSLNGDLNHLADLRYLFGDRKSASEFLAKLIRCRMKAVEKCIANKQQQHRDLSRKLQEVLI